MAIKTGLEDKPWFYAAAVGLVLGGLAYGAIHQLKVTPMKETIASNQNKLAQLQSKISEGRAAQRELPKFREEVRKLELQLEKLLRVLPARRNTPDLLRRIRNLTEQGDLRLLSLKPGNFQDKDFYSEWPIDIRLEGTYHSLALFYDRISRLSRIINIGNLDVSTLQRGEPNRTIGATFTARTFVYRDASEEG